MTEHSYACIDELFARVRLRLLEIRQSDPAVVEDLKTILCQLEDCVESLVIDWLRLKGIKDKPREAGQMKKTSCWEKQEELMALVSQVEGFLKSLRRLGPDGKAEKGNLTEERSTESAASRGKAS